MNGHIFRVDTGALDRMSEVLRGGRWEPFCLTGGEVRSLFEAQGFDTLEQILRLHGEPRPVSSMAT